MISKLLGIILCPISIISLIGAGFSGFVFNLETSANINSELQVAEATYLGEGEIIPLFSEPVIEETFKFSKYGFTMSNGAMNYIGNATSTTSYGGYIKGKTTFYAKKASEFFSSLKSDSPSIKINIELSGTTKIYSTAKLYSTSIIVNGVTATNNASTTPANTTAITYAATIKSAFTFSDIDITSDEYELNFTIVLRTKNQTTFATFYKYYSTANAGFKVKFTAEEAPSE